MKDNLPQKYDDRNIFSKFFGFIKKLFYRKKDEIKEENEVNQNPEEKINSIETDNKNNEFTDRIKIDENYKNPEEEKRMAMEELKGKPELLEELSVDKLEKVLKYYQEENDKKREKLKKLTA